MSAEAAILNVLRLWWLSPSLDSCGLQIPSLLRVTVCVWVGSTQFSEGHGSHRHIHCKTLDRRSMLVTGLDLDACYQTGGSSITPVLSDNWFYSSSLTLLRILLVLHHSGVTVVSNVPSCHDSRPHSSWVNMCPTGNHGCLSLSLQSLCSFLPRWSKKCSRKSFVPSTEGSVWTSIAAYCRTQV